MRIQIKGDFTLEGNLEIFNIINKQHDRFKFAELEIVEYLPPVRLIQFEKIIDEKEKSK